ncbi:FUSC family protein [Pontibacter ramchanderi]|uniref:Aromatic acid exporter family member 1 n=1 Tax=Pontibacter ramchanderi TaxID=1179743 RepID=A0A2N3V1B7_9BACT|nr:aromatic acid exporter family protein [Pontibacter ramchanderi]PKV75428.1 aromatic acid exporter family member 1 [Pontibacter ramchanderi]
MVKFLNILDKMGLTLQIVKTAFAASLSWFVASTLLQSEYPYFAPIAAIITVQVTVLDSVNKATQRIVGIIGGVLLSMLLGHWLSINAFSIFLVILLGMGISKALRMNPQIISQVAISSLLVLAFGHTEEGYAFERIIETVLGSGIAVLINALIVPQNAIPDVERSVVGYSNLSAETLISLSRLIDTSSKRKQFGRREVDALIRESVDSRKTLDLAEQSLKYNLLLTHKRIALSRLAVHINNLESITIQIRGIRRSLADLQRIKPFRSSFSVKEQLQVAMEATANSIAAFGQSVVASSEEDIVQLKQLIRQARLEQDNCLVYLKDINSPEMLRDVGSILTDLKRILTEVER